MSSLLVQLLGTFHVERDGKTLNGFATDKARALLAFLCVERKVPHRRESLATMLWPDQNDERARQSLRQALSHLKQALGSEEFLLISPQDIQLQPQANIWVDVGEAESLTQICNAHHHRSLDQCLPCVKRQQSLLALYRNDFLVGFPSQNSDIFEEWLTLTRERLHQQAMTGHICLATVSQRRGNLADALRHTRAQINLEPWREEAHRQIMCLLASNGERSKALAQYNICRQVLLSELAVDPTTETTALFEAIQNGNLPALNPTPLPSKPHTSFIGRARELDEITERLGDPGCRLITILGMGGIGKSRLALQVALAHHGLYRDGIFYVPLAAASEVPSEIAAALGYSAPDAASHLSELMREKEILLLLDNFDHLVDSSEILSELLAVAPGLQIIVTSRERLRLREEWVYILDGLSYPRERDQVGSKVFDSLALFDCRASQIDSHFPSTEASPDDCSAICRLVEGHPLAIELAASSVAEHSCAEIATALSQTFDALAPTLRNFPVRHRSLRAVFEYSWNLLSIEDRPGLAKLSIFEGGFNAEAAMTVTETTDQQLTDLAAKSFLRLDSNGRYSLHETIRQFAAEKLENAEATQMLHAEYYANWAAGFNGVASSSTLDLLQMERANLRTAWKFSLLSQAGLISNLLMGLALLYALRGPLSEGESLFRETLQSLAGKITTEELVATISVELARICNAQTRHEEAINIVRGISGGPYIQAKAFLLWGQALDAQGECEAARPVLEQSLTLARELGDKRIEADNLRELGNAANRLVEYDVAVPLYAQSLALSKELGDKRGESATLNNWGGVEWDLGDLEAAQAHYLEALSLYRELGNLLGEAKALNNLSNVAADQGDLSAALQYSEQALMIHHEMGNPRGQSAALNNLGATYYSLGQYDTARKHYQQSLVLYRESGNYQAEAETLANLSMLDCAQRYLPAGIKNAQKAIALAEKVGDKVNLANALYYLGRNHMAAGNFESAESALNRANHLRSEIPHPGRLAEIQVELAWVAYKRSQNSLAGERLAPVLEILHDPNMLNGTDNPYRIYQIAVHILALNDRATAESLAEMGKTLLQDCAAKISDPILRQSFLVANDRFE